MKTQIKSLCLLLLTALLLTGCDTINRALLDTSTVPPQTPPIARSEGTPTATPTAPQGNVSNPIETPSTTGQTTSTTSAYNVQPSAMANMAVAAVGALPVPGANYAAEILAMGIAGYAAYVRARLNKQNTALAATVAVIEKSADAPNLKRAVKERAELLGVNDVLHKVVKATT